MNWQKLAKKLEGLQTVDSVAKKLEIKKNTAINYVYKLRKRGFVHNESRGKNKKRLYEIRPWKKRTEGYPGLYEIINENSPVKIVKPYESKTHLEKISIEEALVRAVKEKKFRLLLASLALFRKVEDWFKLYNLSKKEGIGRKIGALYDLSRKYVPKVKRMDKRVRNLLKKTDVGNKYIIPELKSDDFKSIQEEWDVWIPFNKEDLKRYKE